MVFPGLPAAKYQDVTKTSDADLVKLIASPSAVQRLEAQREILQRGKKPAFAEGVFSIAKDAETSLHARIAALWTFKQLYGKGSTKYLVELAADETLRDQALRALSDRRDELEGVPVALFTDALADKNPRVVLQALVGLERLAANDAAPAILAASRDWSDQGVSPRLHHTAVQVLASLADVPALLAADVASATRPTALRAMQKINRMA